MRILLVGDIFADSGRAAFASIIPGLRAELSLDFVVANAENATGVAGLSPQHAQEILQHADAITLGNHALRQRAIRSVLSGDEPVVRPANMPAGAPGKGITYVSTPDGEVAVINLLGQLYVGGAAGSPFEVGERLVEQARARTPIVLVDMHAEATAEKRALALHLAGRASCVFGTHTHVQTSDACVLEGGTAFITDLGMTGPHDSVIGVRSDIIIRRFVTGMGERFEPGNGDVRLEGALLDVDPSTGHARSLEAVRVVLD